MVAQSVSTLNAESKTCFKGVLRRDQGTNGRTRRRHYFRWYVMIFYVLFNYVFYVLFNYVLVICCSTKMFYYALNNIYYLNFHYVLLYVKDVHLNAKIIRIQLNFIRCKWSSDYIIWIPSAYDSFVWTRMHRQFLWSTTSRDLYK